MSDNEIDLDDLDDLDDVVLPEPVAAAAAPAAAAAVDDDDDEIDLDDLDDFDAPAPEPEPEAAAGGGGDEEIDLDDFEVGVPTWRLPRARARAKKTRGRRLLLGMRLRACPPLVMPPPALCSHSPLQQDVGQVGSTVDTALPKPKKVSYCGGVPAQRLHGASTWQRWWCSHFCCSLRA